MKNTTKLFKAMCCIAIIALVAVSGFSFTSCGPSNITGAWEGSVEGVIFTVVLTNSGWTIAVPALEFSQTGTYNRNGNTATLSSSRGTEYGTFTVVNNRTINLTLNSNTDFPGTYTLTKQ